MKPGRLHNLLDYCRRRTGAGTDAATEATDGQLLERFAARQDTVTARCRFRPTFLSLS
jgi:hypothetical protein